MYGEKSLSVARQLQQIGSLYYLSERKDVGVTYYEQAFNIFPDDSKNTSNFSIGYRPSTWN